MAVRENPKGNKEIQESREMSEVVFMNPLQSMPKLVFPKIFLLMHDLVEDCKMNPKRTSFYRRT